MQPLSSQEVSTKEITIGGHRLSEIIFGILLLSPLVLLVLLAHPQSLVNFSCVLVATLLWGWLFAINRSEAVGTDLIATALLFMLLLPMNQSWWSVLLVVSFGVVLGEQIFGGRGDSFMNPVIAGLAFLFYGFQPNAAFAIDSLPAALPVFFAAVLMWYRLLDWRVLIGLGIGYLFIVSITNNEPLTALPPNAVLACLLFAACDSIILPRSTAGRLLIGLIIGMAMQLLNTQWLSFEKTVFIALLASIATPLVDCAVNAVVEQRNRGPQRVI